MAKYGTIEYSGSINENGDKDGYGSTFSKDGYVLHEGYYQNGKKTFSLTMTDTTD